MGILDRFVGGPAEPSAAERAAAAVGDLVKPWRRAGCGAVAVGALVASVQLDGAWTVALSALSGAAVAVLLVVG